MRVLASENTVRFRSEKDNGKSQVLYPDRGHSIVFASVNPTAYVWVAYDEPILNLYSFLRLCTTQSIISQCYVVQIPGNQSF
jgi:hypothetical protein